MTYDAVIFDLFGTLVDFLSEEAREAHRSEIASILGVPPDTFERVWRETMPERDLGRFRDTFGDVENAAMLLGLQPNASLIKKAVQARCEFYESYLQPRTGAIETLTSLRSLGFKTGLITMCGTEIPVVWENTLLAPLMDTCIFSSSEGLAKPDQQIYLVACERLAVSPDRCMYVGDGAYNELAGAKAAGMSPVLIERGMKGPRSNAFPLDSVEQWDGPRVSGLMELLDLLGR